MLLPILHVCILLCVTFKLVSTYLLLDELPWIIGLCWYFIQHSRCSYCHCISYSKPSKNITCRDHVSYFLDQKLNWMQGKRKMEILVHSRTLYSEKPVIEEKIWRPHQSWVNSDALNSAVPGNNIFGQKLHTFSTTFWLNILWKGFFFFFRLFLVGCRHFSVRKRKCSYSVLFQLSW